jgi:hypothetical protein
MKDFKKLIWLVLALVLLVLIVPGIINILHDFQPAGEEFYNLRLARNVIHWDFTEQDGASFFDRPMFFGPYHFVLAAFLLLFGSLAKFILPLALGVASFFLIISLSKRFIKNKFGRLLFFVVLLLSPPFIVMFSTLTQHGFNVFLILLGTFFLFKELRVLNLIVSGLCFYLVIYTSLYFLFLVLLILLFFILKQKDSQKKIMALALVLIAAALSKNLGFFVFTKSQSYFPSLVFDLGSYLGFSLFALLLFLLNLCLDWKNKKKYKEAYAMLGFFILSGIFLGCVINYYFVFIIAYFASNGFFKILRRRWELGQVKTLAAIVLLCGLLLSTSTYFGSIAKEPAVDFEPLRLIQGGVVLSSVENGFMIQSLSDGVVLLDDYSYGLFGFEGVKEDFDFLLYSKQYYDSLKILKKYDVEYIVIDQSMKSEIWENREKGLLFLFRNNETFKNLHSGRDFDIWKVNLK